MTGVGEQNGRRAHLETLKRIIRRLHAGAEPDEVREELRALVRETTADDIAAMEQELIAEGMAVEEIQSMCDLHSSLARELLGEAPAPCLPPGHPLDTFRRENEALRDRVAGVRRLMAAVLAAETPSERAGRIQSGREAAGGLLEVDRHYQRKEQLLFPMLERHGFTGPSTVMWGKHDEARRLLKGMLQALAGMTGLPGEDRGTIAGMVEPALRAVEEMISKEEQILFPVSLEKLSADEWGEIWEQSPEYGWCLVAPREGYRAPGAAAGAAGSSPEAGRTSPVDAGDSDVGPGGSVGEGGGGGLALDTGRLSAEQLREILAVLPVDFTFVDAEDRVAFFSPGRECVFPRSKAVLGRKVQQCHPPKSIAVVERILADFRSGRQSSAEFWIELAGRFVHIRYYAMRGSQGEYLGTLEVTQDATRLRGLTGERRLLHYEQGDFTGR